MTAVREITGKHVLFGFIAFFALIFVANAIFVYLALNSWTGLETRQHYNEGLAYNRILADSDRQKALGWDMRIEVQALDDQRARLAVSLLDKNGDALNGVEVSSNFIRPTHEGYDFELPLQSLGGGQYTAEFTFPMAGQWDVRVTANRGKDRFLMQDRVVLR